MELNFFPYTGLSAASVSRGCIPSAWFSLESKVFVEQPTLEGGTPEPAVCNLPPCSFQSKRQCK